MHDGSYGFGVEEGTPRGEEHWWYEVSLMFLVFGITHSIALLSPTLCLSQQNRGHIAGTPPHTTTAMHDMSIPPSPRPSLLLCVILFSLLQRLIFFFLRRLASKGADTRYCLRVS